MVNYCSHTDSNTTHLELDVVTSKPDLQLLSSVFVLLWPPQIVFFGDFAVLDNALDLGDEEGADRHCFHQSVGRFGQHDESETHSLCE